MEYDSRYLVKPFGWSFFRQIPRETVVYPRMALRPPFVTITLEAIAEVLTDQRMCIQFIIRGRQELEFPKVPFRSLKELRR
jgi:hypothetical protein